MTAIPGRPKNLKAMGKLRYVALLRGINVGGNNIIPMAELRAEFTEAGFTEVATYIQSGNVVFTTSPMDRKVLATKIERTVEQRFGIATKVVVLTAAELEQVVAQAPDKFGQDPDRYRYDVLYVRDPLTPDTALKHISARAGVDTVHASDRVLYFRRLIEKASVSHLNRLVQQPVYQHLTLRNWNTTTRLLAMATD